MKCKYIAYNTAKDDFEHIEGTILTNAGSIHLKGRKIKVYRNFIDSPFRVIWEDSLFFTETVKCLDVLWLETDADGDDLKTWQLIRRFRGFKMPDSFKEPLTKLIARMKDRGASALDYQRQHRNSVKEQIQALTLELVKAEAKIEETRVSLAEWASLQPRERKEQKPEGPLGVNISLEVISSVDREGCPILSSRLHGELTLPDRISNEAPMWVAKVYNLIKEGDPLLASDVLMTEVDNLFLKGEFDCVNALLDRIELDRLDTNMAVGLLCVTWPAADKLPDRPKLVERVRVHILKTETGERVARLLEGLK